jgi:hypothetical protein
MNSQPEMMICPKCGKQQPKQEICQHCKVIIAKVPNQLEILEQEISNLTNKLQQAKLVVKEWTDTSVRLSLSAAKDRARNQGMGRGIGGAIFGSKFRSSARSDAARSNAAIAKRVANERAKIAAGKMRAQENVRNIQAELTSAKERYKLLSTQIKSKSKISTTPARKKLELVTLLQKLKEAYDLGLLTEQEYNEKRQKIVSEL